MAIKLKQSTASQEIPLGYFVDSTDGNTEETALTIANTDIKLWKMGATTLANKNSGGATHISNGIYYAVLDATDTDTLGALVVFVHVSGALSVRVECEVLAANVYDSLIAASDKLEVDVAQFGGSNLTAAGGRPEVNVSHLGGSAIDQTGGLINANVKQISGDAVAADNLETYTDGTAPMPANVTQISGDATAADNAEAFFDGTGYAGTGNVIPTVTNLTNAPAWPAAWDAEVQSEVQDAIEANNLDHLVKIAVDTNFATTVHADSVVGQMADNGAGFDRTTDSLEAIRDNMGTAQTGDSYARLGAPAGASVSADIAAIEAQTDDIGAAGAGLTAIPWNAAWDAEIQSEVVDALQETVPDSIPADGTRPSVMSGIYMLLQAMIEKAVSGTTVTVKKVDGSTTLFTATLDDGTNPTSITRAS